jgi:hypothetical protein
MRTPLLTPAEVLAHFNRRDRHWPQRAAQRGLIEAVNVGGTGNGARYLYRLKPLEAERPEVTREELHWRELRRRG